MKGISAARQASSSTLRTVVYRQQQQHPFPPPILASSSSSSSFWFFSRRRHSFKHFHLSSLSSSSSSSETGPSKQLQQQIRQHPLLQQQARNIQIRLSSLVAAKLEEEEWQTDDDDENDHQHHTKNVAQASSSSSSPSPPLIEKHCETCTCDSEEEHHHDHQQQQPQQQQQDEESQQLIEVYPCGIPVQNIEAVESSLLPPLAEPKFTYRRRVLPSTLVALDSIPGSRRLVETLTLQTAATYLPLSSHFINQSDPAYCGISTLLVVLNALSIDPMVRWRGGWRYYGHEDVLLHRCCFAPSRIQRYGIAVDELAQLAKCHGAHVVMKRPFPSKSTTTDASTTELLDELNDTGAAAAGQEDEEKCFTLNEFRNDLISVLTTTTNTADDDSSSNHNMNNNNTMLVVSFSRASLQQTGDGHYSPVAAYHQATDSVLILDVARFKYPPYWVRVPDLYRAMQPCDAVTNKPRAWFLISSRSNKQHDDASSQELQRQRRPVYDYITSSSNRKSNSTENNTMTRNTSTTYNTDPEGTIPAHLIPAVGQQYQQQSSSSSSSTSVSCPFQAVKVEYCPARTSKSQESNATT
jgi:Phytochelatin synthase